MAFKYTPHAVGRMCDFDITEADINIIMRATTPRRVATEGRWKFGTDDQESKEKLRRLVIEELGQFDRQRFEFLKAITIVTNHSFSTVVTAYIGNADRVNIMINDEWVNALKAIRDGD